MTARVAAPPADPVEEPRRPLARLELSPRIEGVVLGAIAFLAYLVFSALLFAFHVFPGRMSTHYIGWPGADPKIFIWSLRWWPHAIGHGINPFLAKNVWAPTGYDLAWATSIPGPALLLAPITLLAGPIVTYNLLVFVAPALAGWAAYLLCRRVTGRFLPSFAGGYLYGFSTYMVAHLLVAQLNLVLIFLPPLLAYLVLRRLDGSLGPRAFGVLATAGLLLQFLTSTEYFLTTTILGAVALGLVMLLAPELRPRLWPVVRTLGICYGVVLVVVSPYLYYTLTQIPPRSLTDPRLYANDLLDFVIPTKITHFHGPVLSVSSQYIGQKDVQNGYLGVVLLLAMFAFAATLWRTLAGKLLMVAFAVLVVISIGPVLHVGGTGTLTLPWSGLWSLPIAKNVIPDRFAMWTSLVLGAALAMWLALPGRWAPLRFAVVAIGAIMLLPSHAQITWDTPVHVPPFITTGLYRHYVAPGENVAIVPFGGNTGLLWQEETDFAFRVPEGWLGRIPEPYHDMPLVKRMISASVTAADAPGIRALFGRMGVHTVFAQTGKYWRHWKDALLAIDPKPELVAGVYVVRL